jgi:two-component system chemotaxis response regulator CheB
MLRVLLAEDSQTCRELLSAVLEADGRLRIVGQAHDGRAAVEMAEQLRPDVIVMDAHMPVMDGFEATRRIMLACPTPIVIVSATLNVQEVAVSMQALQAGALTLLPKPVSPLDRGFAELAPQFAATVRAMADVKVVRRFNSHRMASVTSAPSLRVVRRRVSVIGIAASTGGPAALQQILRELPEGLPVPVLVVQHMARGFTEGLTAWLNALSPLTVKLAEHAEPLRAGHVYFAPDECQLTVNRAYKLDLTHREPCDGFLPSATVLFRSLSDVYGAAAVGLILTGMGQDGVAGLRDLRQTGATIIAQDEQTSVVFGMPAAAIAEGLPQVTLPLEEIAGRLMELVGPDDRETGRL